MEIVIALDAYDDIYSDFDIRGYGERAISKDFLDELHIRLRRIGAEKRADIVLLVPAGDRVAGDESLIVERMRDFFADRRLHYLREYRAAKRNFVLFVAIGLGLSFVANVFVERLNFFPLFKDFLLIPAWFFVWSGLELFLKDRAETSRKRKYYSALSASSMTFADLEGYGNASARTERAPFPQ